MTDKQKNTNASSENDSMNVQSTQLSSDSGEAKFQAPDPNAIYANVQQKLESASKSGSIASNPVNQHWKQTRKPRFEIELYEEQTNADTGEITGFKKVLTERPIIIEAASKADLDEHASRYKFCHQRMKIIRKIDDGDMTSPQQQIQAGGAGRDVMHEQPSSPEIQASHVIQKQKPKFYKIGDIEIKDDNGKIYQKQWMKLSESEMSNFRLISDKNNSIVNINGKHLEMKKWVLVEKTDDESSVIEESLHD